MSKADDGLRKIIHDCLPKPDWAWTPLETGGTTNGVPDSHFLHRPTGRQGWVESKKSDGWAVKVEPHQVAWHEIRAEHCNTFFAVRTRGVAASGGMGDGMWLIRGTAAKLLADGGLRAALEGGAVIGTWRGSPRRWAWWEIERLLTGRIV
jgi:hypothetical protein